jgi:hypothetical protein
MNQHEQIAALADAITGKSQDYENTDLCEIYETLQPVMPTERFIDLGCALELCPLHFCDMQICKDDGIHGDEVYGLGPMPETKLFEITETQVEVVNAILGNALDQHHDAKTNEGYDYLQEHYEISEQDVVDTLRVLNPGNDDIKTEAEMEAEA